MVIAYHAIFTTYGTWLPNDPRGSFSKEIYNEQLRVLGNLRYGRQNPQPSKELLIRFWAAAHLFSLMIVPAQLLLPVSVQWFNGWVSKFQRAQ